MRSFWTAISTTIVLLFAASGAFCQVPPVKPREIVIYVHQDVRDDSFVAPLVCALGRTLVAPVRVGSYDLPIGSGSTVVSESVLGEMHRRAGPFNGTVMFLLVPYPVSLAGRQVFGTNYGEPYNKGVISLPSLAAPSASLPANEAIVQRTYKVLLRYIGQIGGLWEKSGCVMKMPRGLAELDAKPAEFCDDDRAALVAAGIVKAQPGGVCGPVAGLSVSQSVAVRLSP